ncbi:hypothetical protein BGZ83_006546 [Gryganskiella cystojenkinii]|nr:hypothetical protein BGZ83_006546 [Gryganskiella cystojenkinii]
MAQIRTPSTPQPVQEMAFARGWQYLYVTGGKYQDNNIVENVTGQTFALDLSKPWPTSSAPWTGLSDGPVLNLHNAVMTSDNQTLIAFYQGPSGGLTIYRYNIMKNSWTSEVLSDMPSELRQGIRPVLDPKTNLVYINAEDFLDTYAVASDTMSYPAIPSGFLTARDFAGACYNAGRRSIMYHGGFTLRLDWESSAYITEYQLDTQQWSNFTTIGTAPTLRSDHCMAASEDGNTIVVFGGRTPTNTSSITPTNFTGTFYTLDVPSRTWRQGPSSDTRLYMACVIVGTQFIAWGGSNGPTTISGPPVVFDLQAYQWVDHYTPPSYLLNTKPGSGSGDQNSPSSSSSSPNIGAILGGVFGGLLAITLAGLLCLRKRRRTRGKSEKTTAQHTTGRQSGFGSGFMTQYTEGSGFGPMMTRHVGGSGPDLTTRNPQLVQKNHAEPPRNPHGQVAVGDGFDLRPKQNPQLGAFAGIEETDLWSVPSSVGYSLLSPNMQSSPMARGQLENNSPTTTTPGYIPPPPPSTLGMGMRALVVNQSAPVPPLTQPTDVYDRGYYSEPRHPFGAGQQLLGQPGFAIRTSGTGSTVEEAQNGHHLDVMDSSPLQGSGDESTLQHISSTDNSSTYNPSNHNSTLSVTSDSFHSGDQPTFSAS